MFKFVKIIKTSKKNLIRGDINQVVDTVKTLATGYEVITDSCIPYYDFEREYDTESERLANYQTDLDFSISALSQYKQHTILEFTACGYDNTKNKYKNSFHFRIRGFGYYKSANQIPKISGFDPAVYNSGSQLFRLPYCTKEGQKRPLKRFNSRTGDIIELDDITEKYEEYLVQNVEGEKLIEVDAIRSQFELLNKIELNSIDNDVSSLSEDTCIEYIHAYIKKASESSSEIKSMLENFRYKSHMSTEKNIIINFNRRNSSFCKICDRTHDTDNTFYISVMTQSNKIFWSCIRNKKAQFICNIDNSHELLNTEVLNTSVDTYKKSPDLPNTITVNEKYCSNITILTDSIKNETPLIVLKSNMGTGKTYCVSQCINEIDWATAIGLISFRISLAEKYADDFKNFVCYNTKKEKVIDDAKWICQADSLYRIKSTEPLDILILDEVDQLRKHMTATTFMRNSNYLANRASLKHIIKTAKQIIIMSANITKADINWIESMRVAVSNATAIVITNTYISESRKINMVSKLRVIESAINDYKQKRKFVIAHNGSTVKQEALKRQILLSTIEFNSIDDDILVINSETMLDDNVKEALKNPNLNFAKYAGIIYSPSVQSGLSYDVKNTIHSIYGIFGNCSNSSNDICQMLHRIRHPISNELKVCIEMFNFGTPKPTTTDAMMRSLKTARSHIYSQNKESDIMAILERIPFEYNRYGEIDFQESDILHEYCRNKSEHNLDSILFKKNFISSQLEYGNAVVFDETDTGLKKTKEDMKKLNIEVNLEIATELSEATEIDDTTAIELKKKVKNTPDLVEKDEYTQIKKYNINNLYKVKGNTPQWYLKYGSSSTKKHYCNLSIYYKKNQSLELSLSDLKKSECVGDVYHRVDENAVKSTDKCIVDSILSKPRYMKHRVLIGWLDTLGFDKLDSNVEIKQDDLKANLAIILNNITETDFDCLEKNKRNLETIKKLKPSDKLFVQNMLKFINGSLLSEFNIKVNKKSKHSNVYVLFNEYIKDDIFLNPFNASGNIYIPRLGSIKDKIELNTNTSDEPYDSDDED
jgi:hypothetical protein